MGDGAGCIGCGVFFLEITGVRFVGVIEVPCMSDGQFLYVLASGSGIPMKAVLLENSP